jgi:hypothetical protein
VVVVLTAVAVVVAVVLTPGVVAVIVLAVMTLQLKEEMSETKN